MNRREFLQRLGGAAAGVALSPMLDLAEIAAAPASIAGWTIRVIDNPTYSFGFTGFVAAEDLRPGHYGWIKQLTIDATQPRLQRMLYGEAQ